VKQASVDIVLPTNATSLFLLLSSDPLNLLLIKFGAGTEAVGLFESIHLFVDKLMLQNAITVELNERPVCA
jgi:hypothetical protein